MKCDSSCQRHWSGYFYWCWFDNMLFYVAYDQGRRKDSDVSSIMSKENSKICNTGISKAPVAWNYTERNGIPMNGTLNW